MVRNLLIFSGFMAFIAMALPDYLNRNPAPVGGHEQVLVANERAGAPPVPSSQGGGRDAYLQQDARGHFSGTFTINGRPVEGMIDTGASLIALPESVARRIGFSPATLNFNHPVSTANGQTMSARITLDRVEIGPVRAFGVQAVVIRDEALSSPLIGMSFLSKISGYSVSSGRMKLSS
jgi:aspartyl protease family protein